MKKKKTGIAFLLLAFILGVVIANPAEAAASQYLGGLLDGEPIQVGAAIGQGAPVTELTDNNPSNRVYLDVNKLAWYTFASPKTINSVVLKINGAVKVEFYDDKNNLLLTYRPLAIEGVQTLPTAVSNVTTVVLKADLGSYAYVHEWNVFETPSTPPSPTTINWIQGGDSTVTLDWNASGAKAYNVGRSTSLGGPYPPIASNIVGTTYTDKSVENGKTYYYVVTAVNEAGGSVESPAKSIKPEATQYTGGLLDGVVIDLGPNMNKPEKKSKTMTDNNVGTREYIDNNLFAWHKFAKPEEINSIVLNTNGNAKIEFYDENYNLLYTYVSLNVTGIQTLPSTVSNVTTVVLKSDPGSYAYVHEWNVFRKPSKAPQPTKITWSYGGDKVAKLEWEQTGAKSYNVGRGSSLGGPYPVIASNITGTTYTDKSVENGKTYYYVITAVNEAGKSEKSPEKSIQPKATKYTGGLLDARVVDLGPTVGNKTKQTKDLTDNNTGTRVYIDSNSIAWYKFMYPKEISSFIVNRNGEVTLELYDDNDNLLLSYKSTKIDEVEMLPEAVKGVKTVVIKSPPGVYAYVHEWNVFGDNPEEPSQEPIQLNAVSGNKQVVLNWSDGNGATGFQVKRSDKAGGPYTAVTTVTGTTNNFKDTAVTNGKTYYYVVTAFYGPVEGVTSNEAFATPKSGGVTPPGPGTDPGTGTGTKPGQGSGDGQSGNRALLSLTLNNGIQKEYDLSMAEVESFIAWYDGRAAGNGSVMFAFDKHNNNKGPFKNRKDYVFFDKIITFEVNGYDVEGTSAGNKEPEQQKPENKEPEVQEPENQYPSEEY